MKTTLKKTIEVEVDINLPYYFKNICHAYAIFDEQTSVMINHASTGGESINNYSFMIENVLLRSNEEDSIEISSEEFHKIYNEVYRLISSKTLTLNLNSML